MKFISWNVNGLRAAMQKGWREAFDRLDADVFCLQETKMRPEQLQLELPGYRQYWNSADKAGYSGTAVFCRREPLSVQYGMGIDEHDHEGRLITLEFEQCWLVCCYTPNAQDELRRIDYRMQWEDDLRAYLCRLDAVKPVVYCGDLNVAHNEIDLKNPGPNRGHAGFSDQERGKFTELLEAGFADTYRRLHPDLRGYSWWSYRAGARARNVGWRIDYFVVSERVMPWVRSASIYPEIEGSDHCPVGLELAL